MIILESTDFNITEAIRFEISKIEDALWKRIPTENKIHVTLSKATARTFAVLMQTHYLGESIVSRYESHNFHKAVDYCREHFVKQVDRRREKIRQSYRRQKIDTKSPAHEGQGNI